MTYVNLLMVFILIGIIAAILGTLTAFVSDSRIRNKVVLKIKRKHSND